MKLSTLKLLVRHFGPGWVAYRAWKSASEKLGYWKFKLPSRPWAHFGSPQFVAKDNLQKTAQEFFAQRKFFFDPKSLKDSRDWLKSLDPNQRWAEESTNKIEKGVFPYFSARWQDIGEQPNWFLNPYTGQTIPGDLHFSQINEFGFGDVKAVWEASRLPFVFVLARSFARSGDDRCGEVFWQHLELWMDANPPYQGINWKCGQESGLRFIAAVFGLFVFSQSPSTSKERLQRFTQFAAATANRIDKHIAYAISQKNNHGISEAVALWTIGVLFPEFKQAAKWKAKGLKILEQLCAELIYDDGAFSQHSANYHRLVLHLLSWITRLATVNQVHLSDRLMDRFDKAIEFLGELINAKTGQAPCYGNDDGAMILPLNHCDYFDFRPVVQLGRAVRDNSPSFGAGPWNEDLFWFGLTEKLGQANTDNIQQHAPKAIHITEQGGYHRLQLNNTTAFVRAGKFKHRPTQSDQMHVDLFWKGHNIAIDPGTYSYNGPEYWKSIPFMKSQHHNTVIVDGKEPEAQVSKFLLLPWNESHLVDQHQTDRGIAAEWKRVLKHNLKAEVTHHRAVIVLADEVTIVVDSLSSKDSHAYQLGWLLGGELSDQHGNWISLQRSADTGNEFFVHTSSSCPLTMSCVVGQADSARGWYAPHYMELKPAISIHAQATGERLTFQTTFGPDKSLAEKYTSLQFSDNDSQASLLKTGALIRLLKANHA